MPRLLACAVLLLLAACGSGPNPSRPPTASTAMGRIEIELEIAPGATQFFASQHRARLLATDGTILADWEITDAAAPLPVPAGTHQLQAFTVFLSDFIQCSADPSAPGKEHCGQPTLGPSQVCAIPIEVIVGGTVTARFRSLPEGACQLVGPT